MFDATGWTLCEPPLEERHDSVVPPLLMPPRFKLPAPSLAGEDVAPLVVPLLDGAPLGSPPRYEFPRVGPHDDEASVIERYVLVFYYGPPVIGVLTIVV